ncbi:tetratricopeptide repeat protein [Bacillus paralicheniformis]|uniref:response regulator aspartate phosphatase n=1 Tax=Bacillus paralicheniformis TaxID=1648923 RepID=UPI00237CE3FE|nr:tetratricopeptide repeat protein [Bacillus paralicheniformis]MDE1393863.1 tetratricopeptide repeat protein [Bacillus paralicheniformis]
MITKKLNEWYTAIKDNLDEKAERLKKEVEGLIGGIDGNLEFIYYHQLLDFRHELMLSHLKSKDGEEINNAYETLKEHEGHLNGMLDYYYFFFKGMYDFKRKDLVAAISAYRRAEKSLEFVEDEIERAEFYYKMAEVYYYMKQTYYSIDYIERAITIYNKYETYLVKIIYCNYIIAGNLIDLLEYEKAMFKFNEALKIAKQIKRDNLVAISHLNIGICFNVEGLFEKAKKNLMIALKFFEKEYHPYLIKTLFNLSHVMCKSNELENGEFYYEKGFELALNTDNSEYIAKFNLLRGLYLNQDCFDLIDAAFEFLESNEMYGDIDEFAFEVGEVLLKRGEVARSSKYYQKVVMAKKQIQKGEMINETQIDNLLISHTSGGGVFNN